MLNFLFSLQAVEDSCVQNLEEKFAESEDELNNMQSSGTEETLQTHRESLECTEMVPEKRGRALETPDSIGDIQVIKKDIKCCYVVTLQICFHILLKRK